MRFVEVRSPRARDLAESELSAEREEEGESRVYNRRSLEQRAHFFERVSRRLGRARASDVRPVGQEILAPAPRGETRVARDRALVAEPRGEAEHPLHGELCAPEANTARRTQLVDTRASE